jgi:hypothetical protein
VANARSYEGKRKGSTTNKETYRDAAEEVLDEAYNSIKVCLVLSEQISGDLNKGVEVSCKVMTSFILGVRTS